MALVTPERLRRILTKMLDENEFLSPYGIRSLSRCHAEHPYTFDVAGQEYRVGYVPGDSDSGMRVDGGLPIDRRDIDAIVHDFDAIGRDPVTLEDRLNQCRRGDEHVDVAVLPARERVLLEMEVDAA